MITILISNLNTMMVTKSENIMQRSKNAHIVRFFVPEQYNDWDMSEFTFGLEAVLPNGEYKTLVLDQELPSSKEGFLEYRFELDSTYTRTAGTIELQGTFTYVEDSTATTYVRKTTTCPLTVTAIAKWADLVTDEALGALDQAMVTIESQVNALNAVASRYEEAKADNISLTNDNIQLTSHGRLIGNSIKVVVSNEEDDNLDASDGVIDNTINLNKIISI